MTFKDLSKKWKTLFVLLLIIGLGSLVVNGILFSQVRLLKNPAQATQEDIKKIIEDVSKVLVLPDNETPTLATVSDLSALKDQPFFAHAEVGDKVLVYANSKKAILWRPSTKQVVEVSTINLEVPPTQQAPLNTKVGS